ncbi:MAG: hypothetical protein WB992_17890 [Bryobacteraceae bacterium]
MKILALCLAATLQAQINAPRVGIARYSGGQVRTIYGIEANFIVGEPLPTTAAAVSFSDFGGLISRGGHIQLIRRDGSLIADCDCGEAAPVLNIDGTLTTAIAWLPSRQALLHWNGKSFVLTQLTSAISEYVTSLRIQDPNSATLLLLTIGGKILEATVSLETGNLMSMNPLPEIRGPALLQHSFIVFHDRAGLEIKAADGALRTLSFPIGDLTIERMSSDWLHLSSATTRQDWALHLSNVSLHLSQLPALREAGK